MVGWGAPALAPLRPAQALLLRLLQLPFQARRLPDT